MVDPLGFTVLSTPASAAASAARGQKLAAPQPGADFATTFREQLEQVSAVQNEADRKVQDVLTGKSDNIGDVFVAARKAEFAFSMLMEIRNKLVDSYEELRQLRI